MNRPKKKRKDLNENGDTLKRNLLIGTIGLVFVGIIAFVILATIENWWTPIGQWFTSQQFIFVLISVVAFALIVVFILHLIHEKDMED